MSSAVSIQNLTTDLKSFHLQTITLEIHAGDYFIILGPTGSGKTVLLETIAGLHRPRAGRILLDGKDVTTLPPEKRGIGFVYQHYALFPHLSVAENIAFGLKVQGVSEKERQNRSQQMAKMLKIDHLLARKPQKLSGGEQQRVALARALVISPRLLLLDEPLGALDPETRENVQRELARLHREMKTTTIHVTHDFEEAIALGRQVAVMHRGRIMQAGAPEDIFRRPASEFVARFVGVRNIFSGRIERDARGSARLAINGISIAVVTGLQGAVHGSIRPEDVILSDHPLRSSMRNTFRGRIVEIANRGAVAYVTVRISEDGPEHASLDVTSMITGRSLAEMALHEGKEVCIAFKASAVHVF